MASTFQQWIKTQVSRDDKVGRFARDVAGDAKAPEGVSMHVWLDHLRKLGAGPGATQAFHDAWFEFLGRR